MEGTEEDLLEGRDHEGFPNLEDLLQEWRVTRGGSLLPLKRARET